ncbi:MAG: hypothetical protein MJB14_11645 [Spirochaetes bacterium]|nr:hypothetical protein [Spirochaetota bacterium]
MKFFVKMVLYFLMIFLIIGFIGVFLSNASMGIKIFGLVCGMIVLIALANNVYQTYKKLHQKK